MISEEVILPTMLIILGFTVGLFVYILLMRFSKLIITHFDLFPESQGFLKIALKIITSLISITIFLLFLRLGLKYIGLEFTVNILENTITESGKYITGIIIILAGMYISRLIKEKVNTNKQINPNLIYFSDIIINLTFVLTALATMGIDLSIFKIMYSAIIFSAAIIFALIVGLPIGMSFHKDLEKKQFSKNRKKLKKH